MGDFGWEDKRELRIQLLKISDEMQSLSIKLRSQGLPQEYAVELNSLQIKVSELIGRLWVEK